jgi:hypothetical protein
MSEPDCKKCGEPVSLERGIVAVGDLNATGMDYYCEECAPNRGEGYTLADLEQWQRESREERAVDDLKRKTRVMDLLGPDVYFQAGFGGSPVPGGEVEP